MSGILLRKYGSCRYEAGRNRQRIEPALGQYGQHAANAIELVINEVRSGQGGTVNGLID